MFSLRVSVRAQAYVQTATSLSASSLTTLCKSRYRTRHTSSDIPSLILNHTIARTCFLSLSCFHPLLPLSMACACSAAAITTITSSSARPIDHTTALAVRLTSSTRRPTVRTQASTSNWRGGWTLRRRRYFPSLALLSLIWVGRVTVSALNLVGTDARRPILVTTSCGSWMTMNACAQVCE